VRFCRPAQHGHGGYQRQYWNRTPGIAITREHRFSPAESGAGRVGERSKRVCRPDGECDLASARWYIPTSTSSDYLAGRLGLIHFNPGESDLPLHRGYARVAKSVDVGDQAYHDVAGVWRALANIDMDMGFCLVSSERLIG
jgi:hypothetical protein